MKKCMVDNCDLKYYGKGYCSKHYHKYCVDQMKNRKKREDNPEKYGFCSIDGCNKVVYAKGYCRNHYSTNLRNGTPLGYKVAKNIKKCFMLSCKNGTLPNEDYCRHHLKMLRKYGTIESDYRIISKTGKNNPRWNGGKADYPKHSEFKRQRKIKIKESNGLCEKCGDDFKYVHHIDGSKDNHALENLICLCSKCHWKEHTGRNNKTSKLKRIYGMTVKEIMQKTGMNYGRIYNLHKKNELKELLACIHI